MPLDDLSLDLTPAASPEPDLEVMTRVLRLPTGSSRQARRIVGLQLDRLSPLPPTEVLYDLVSVRRDGAETVYALGLLRRSALSDPAFAARRTIQVSRSVDGVEASFRFRNAGAVTDRESRWLVHAPRIALACLGLAAVALAGHIRAEQWRERRLPEIAAEQRQAAREARQAQQQQEAWAEWNALERTDAATRLLCVTSRISSDPLPVTALSADAGKVTLSPATAAAQVRLRSAGGSSTAAPAPAADQPGPVDFAGETCA